MSALDSDFDLVVFVQGSGSRRWRGSGANSIIMESDERYVCSVGHSWGWDDGERLRMTPDCSGSEEIESSLHDLSRISFPVSICQVQV